MVETERLLLRPTEEADRLTFVRLFCDPEFMVFAGELDETAAHVRFDIMLERSAELTFAKQPVIERASGRTLGYAGVNWFEFEGERRLEFGWRLIPQGRGKGLATEAGRALIDLASASFQGEILAMIDPTNEPSLRVGAKLGFEYWKMAWVNGYLDGIHRLTVG